MFDFLKKLLPQPKHRHRETVVIYFSFSVMRGFGLYRRPMIQEKAITCYLHTCPECGDILEYGHAAKLNGEKFGNFWTVRKSLRLAKLIWATQLENKLDKLRGIESVARFSKTNLSIWFERKDKTINLPEQAALIGWSGSAA